MEIAAQAVTTALAVNVAQEEIAAQEVRDEALPPDAKHCAKNARVESRTDARADAIIVDELTRDRSHPRSIQSRDDLPRVRYLGV